jgi:hypothetical protein
VLKTAWARAALVHPVFTGVTRQHLSELIEELADPWMALQESCLRERRGHDRLRAAGAGPDHDLVFVDRVIVTLVTLRLQLPRRALAELYGVSRFTIGRAVREIRGLLARRGFAVPQCPGLRLRTLEDVFAYAEAEGIEVRFDGTEIQVRRPGVGRPGRKAFVSGKKKQNTVEGTMFTDAFGRALFFGVIRPGRMHDVTAVRSEGIEEQLRRRPQVKARVDAGYQGLARDFPGQVSAPPRKPAPDAPPGVQNSYQYQRRAQSSRRICVEHAIAEPKAWRSLQRWLGRREDLPDTMLAITGLVSDRSAQRIRTRKPSKELALATRPM